MQSTKFFAFFSLFSGSTTENFNMIFLYTIYVIVNLALIAVVLFFTGVKSGASNFVSSITDRAIGASRGLDFSRKLVIFLIMSSTFISVFLMRKHSQYITDREKLAFELSQIKTSSGTTDTEVSTSQQDSNVSNVVAIESFGDMARIREKLTEAFYVVEDSCDAVEVCYALSPKKVARASSFLKGL